MKFKKTDLQEMLWEESDHLKVISNKMISQGRWMTNYKVVFECDGRYYESSYSKGSTENQDGKPWEYDGEAIECKEVFKKEKVIIVYE